VADAAEIAGRPFAWRLRVHDVPAFVDTFRGPVCLSREDIGGDFVVWKSQGTPAYQLAVVVDDSDNGITHVVRGDDLIPSTPRQLLLYRALGLAAPAFAHVPLVVGPDGRRLAKRHGDTRLSAVRAAGVRADQVIGLLAWSCGWQPEPTPITAAALVPRFRLNAIPPQPFVVTPELLARIGFNP
jgi:glutamyl-tRNA synthetase